MDDLTAALMTREDREQLADWESREIPEDTAKEIQKDLLAYVEWGKATILGVDEASLEEGKRLFAKMKKWKPDMFPKKK